MNNTKKEYSAGYIPKSKHLYPTLRRAVVEYERLVREDLLDGPDPHCNCCAYGNWTDAYRVAELKRAALLVTSMETCEPYLISIRI